MGVGFLCSHNELKEVPLVHTSFLLLLQYLKMGSLHDPVIDDVKNYKVCEEAMDKMGMTATDRQAVYQLVAAVLHLGNIAFEENVEDTKGFVFGYFNCIAYFNYITYKNKM